MGVDAQLSSNGLYKGPRYNIRVRTKGQLDYCMTQTLLDNLPVDTLLKHYRGMAVAYIVKPECWGMRKY